MQIPWCMYGDGLWDTRQWLDSLRPLLQSRQVSFSRILYAE